ncbi:MAG: PAS domain S-box protein [Proteobacteria bacterium]|nr:PAS domain S-box protein [Pseudomonadota bacterium]MBU1737594.1 PAS domain S-box protein [Pseudomonadota bacterium]
MTVIHFISIVMVTIGTGLMIWAISSSLQLHRQVPVELNRRWVLLTGLMVFFHFGYLGFIVILITGFSFPLELWSAAIMLAGACFVLLFVKLGEVTILKTKESGVESGEINQKLLAVNLALHDENREKERIGEELRSSKAHLENIFNSSIPLCITSFDHLVTEANDAYCEIFGRLPESAETRCYDSRPGPSCNTPRCPMARIAGGDTEVTCESVKVEVDGSRHHFLVTARPFIDYDGQVTGIIESFQDITGLKEAEKALAQEKDRLYVTLKSIIDGVIATDKEGRVVVSNEAARKMTGWSEEEIAGRKIGEVLSLRDSGTNKMIDDPAGKILQGEKPEIILNHCVLMAKDGWEKDVSFRVSPMTSGEQGIEGAVLVFQDISGKIKIEKEMARVQRLESIGLLAGGIAHDFNNILTAIMNNLSLAAMTPDLDEKLAKRIESTEQAVMKAKSLTGQLLTFAKGGAPIKKVLQVGGMLRDAVEFALHGSNVGCEFAIGDDLWPAEYDIGQMQQVVSNLVINADQAMEAGGVLKVTAENHLAAENSEGFPVQGRYLKIVFQDEGCGIAEENLPLLFDPYYTTKATGSGLGLAMVYSIVTRHGGQLLVDSKVGQGTVFTLFLPASEGTPEEGDFADSAGKEKREGGGGAGRRVLVMDDDAEILALLKEFLEEEGFEAVCVDDGAAAVQEYGKAFAAGNRFACVVMDLTVPGGLGGKDAFAMIRKLDPEVTGLVSSGYSNDPVMADFEKFGFAGMVIKPYKGRELVDKIYQVI